MSSGYLDDLFLVGTEKQKCVENIAESVSLLRELGFTLNYDKSVLQPTRSINHLGFTLCSDTMTVALGSDKFACVKGLCESKLQCDKLTVRILAGLIGTLVSCFPGVEFGPLYYRHLEKNKSDTLKSNNSDFESAVSLTSQAKQEVLWWINNANSCPRPISHGNAQFTLQTDASALGWGGTRLDTTSTGGRWLPSEKSLHINELELTAVLFSLKALCKTFQDVHIQLQIDNMTAVSYIREMGGSQSSGCNKIAFDIWEWCIQRHIWLSATHIPGRENIEADRKSRLFDDKTEWKLDSNAFIYCVELWGQPDIDMFASQANYQFKPYVAWKPDPEALAIDAFSINWSHKFVYLFPPFSLIPRVLQKLEEDRSRAILISPCWPTQTWFPCLRRLMIAPPLQLPKSKTLLTLPGHDGLIHPLHPKLTMKAFLLSAEDSASIV